MYPITRAESAHYVFISCSEIAPHTGDHAAVHIISTI